VMTFLAVVSSPLPSSHVVYRRLSSVLSKFSHKKFFRVSPSPVDGVNRNGPPPIVTPLFTMASIAEPDPFR